MAAPLPKRTSQQRCSQGPREGIARPLRNSHTGQLGILLQFKITECHAPCPAERDGERETGSSGTVATGRSLLASGETCTQPGQRRGMLRSSVLFQGSRKWAPKECRMESPRGQSKFWAAAGRPPWVVDLSWVPLTHQAQRSSEAVEEKIFSVKCLRPF